MSCSAITQKLVPINVIVKISFLSSVLVLGAAEPVAQSMLPLCRRPFLSGRQALEIFFLSLFSDYIDHALDFCMTGFRIAF
jgi:hypothetical protein